MLEPLNYFLPGSLPKLPTKPAVSFLPRLDQTGGPAMLNFFGAKSRFCDGLSRRDFLKVGALGVGGLSLADLLRLRAQGNTASGSHKAVIMVYLNGGPSHMDM